MQYPLNVGSALFFMFLSIKSLITRAYFFRIAKETTVSANGTVRTVNIILSDVIKVGKSNSI